MRSWPSIYIPPWAGGGSPRRDLTPVKPTQLREACGPVGLLPADPVVEGGDRDRHFHQLLRQLRLREHRALRGGVQRDLGHVNNLLATRSQESAGYPPAGQPSAAQEHRETGRARTSRAWAPRCAVEPVPVAPAALPGRHPPESSSYRLKSTGWGGGVVRTADVYFNSLSSSPALAFLCPREEWC